MDTLFSPTVGMVPSQREADVVCWWYGAQSERGRCVLVVRCPVGERQMWDGVMVSLVLRCPVGERQMWCVGGTVPS